MSFVHAGTVLQKMNILKQYVNKTYVNDYLFCL